MAAAMAQTIAMANVPRTRARRTDGSGAGEEARRATVAAPRMPGLSARLRAA